MRIASNSTPAVQRLGLHVRVEDATGGSAHYDHVVIATDAAPALVLRDDVSRSKRRYVMAGIHWETFQPWRKWLHFADRPQPLCETVTIVTSPEPIDRERER